MGRDVLYGVGVPFNGEEYRGLIGVRFRGGRGKYWGAVLGEITEDGRGKGS